MHQRVERSAVERYGVALAAMGVFVGIRLLFKQGLTELPSFLYAIPVVMVGAWYGGLGPGLLATLIGAVACDLLFFNRRGEGAWNTRELNGFIFFLLAGVVISWLSGELHRQTRKAALANEQLAYANGQLEKRVRDRTAELAFRTSLLEAETEASRDGILATSAQGRVILFNKRFTELFDVAGLSPGGPLAAATRAIAGGPHETVAALAMQDAVESPADALPREMSLRDGRTIECYSAPILDQAAATADAPTPAPAGRGQPIATASPQRFGRVWFFRDVTLRKRLERELLGVSEREKRRIAHDLHDGLGPHLVGISLMGKALESELAAMPGGRTDLTGTAGRIAELIDEAIAHARSLAKGLRPVAVETGGLAVALEELTGIARRLYGIKCSFEHADDDVTVTDPNAATHLYRIAQEAINNAVKHGRAKNLRVRLSEVDAHDPAITDEEAAGLAGAAAGQLTITDDGIGIPQPLPAPSRSSGLGLQIMQYRANAVGGTLRLSRGPTGGTVVICVFPQTPTMPPPAAPISAIGSRAHPSSTADASHRPITAAAAGIASNTAYLETSP